MPRPSRRRRWVWPLAVIAAGLVVGLVLSVLGIGFRRGQERTLFTVDACPDPPTSPDGDLPLPEDPVAARATARWQPDDAGATPQDVTAILSPGHPGAHDELGVCQRGQPAVYGDPGGNGSGRGPVLGELPGGRRDVRTSDGRGRLVIAEGVSTQQSVPDHGANDFGTFPGWYLTAVDPAPGTYRWTTPVTWWADREAAAEPGTLVVELAPDRHDVRTRARMGRCWTTPWSTCSPTSCCSATPWPSSTAPTA